METRKFMALTSDRRSEIASVRALHMSLFMSIARSCRSAAVSKELGVGIAIAVGETGLGGVLSVAVRLTQELGLGPLKVQILAYWPGQRWHGTVAASGLPWSSFLFGFSKMWWQTAASCPPCVQELSS